MSRRQLFENYECNGLNGWAGIVLSSPMGLLIAAILAAGGLGALVPSSSAETAVVAAAPFDAETDATRSAARRTVSVADLRALVADPEVRQFRGLSENAWDFTDPQAVPGFGSLYVTGDQSAGR